MILVLDANELFSAMIAQGETLRLFFDGKLTLISPEFILEEFMEHKSEIIEKSGLDENDAISFLLLISPKIQFFNVEEYKEFMPKAKEISSDPDDIEYLALALKLNCPIWSEDKRLKKQAFVKVINTVELLKELE